jgi:predicted ArsR family transcriptional regulator
MSRAETEKTWTFVTNHTQVLLCLARNPDMRLRDVAADVGITERAAQRILAELVEAGNQYTINRSRAMRHAAQSGHDIGELLDMLESDHPTANGQHH